MTDRQIFEAGGRAIAYADDGDGPAVVLALGPSLDIAHLDTLVHILSDEGFRVLRIESRNAADDGVTTADLAQDVVDVMDAAGIADAWIGGHADGGEVARTVASAHTDRANGILLLSVEGGPAALEPGVPVLIVHGTADETTPLANAETLQASAPDRATLVRIEGAGHLFPSTHPGEAAFAIAEYLDWD